MSLKYKILANKLQRMFFPNKLEILEWQDLYMYPMIYLFSLQTLSQN